VHLDDSRWSRPRVGVLSIAIPLLVVGCAFGTEGPTHRLSESDMVPLEDSGYGDAPAYSSGDSGVDSGHFVPDSGVPLPDTGEAVDRHAPIDAPLTCALKIGTGDPSCDACLSTSCCTQDNACAGDPACIAVNDCMATCAGAIPPDAGLPPDDAGRDAALGDAGPGVDAGMAACFSDCQVRFPVGASLLSALDMCLTTTCATGCAGFVGGP